MQSLKRGLISIKRTPGKTALVLLLFVGLGTFLSIGFSMRQAIINTELNLRERLPSIATLAWDHRAAGYDDREDIIWETVTTDTIRSIAELPFVRDYEMTTQFRLFSHHLNLVIPELDGLLQTVPEDTLQDFLAEIESGFTRNPNERFELIEIYGVSNAEPAHLEIELIALTDGRFMTREEMQSGAPVVLVSSLFAEENRLTIGSMITLEDEIMDISVLISNPPEEYRVGSHEFRIPEDRLSYYQLYSYSVDVEVIGIFEVNRHHITSVGLHISDVIDLYNQFYAPLSFVENLAIQRLPFERESLERMHAAGARENRLPTEDELFHIEVYFLLDDPRDFRVFEIAASEVLPPYWNVVDTSNAILPFLMSMDTMLWIADVIFFGALIATVIILSLVMTLLLKERRHEIGIYLALGEKKRRIIGQISMEFLVIAVMGIALSLLIGNQISNQLSHHLLEQEILSNPPGELITGENFHLRLFIPVSLSTEEMMAAYDASLEASQIIAFVSIQLGTTLLSIVIPISYILKLEPKRILL